MCASILKLWRVVCSGNGAWIIEFDFFLWSMSAACRGTKVNYFNPITVLYFFIKVCCSGANQDSLLSGLFSNPDFVNLC